MARERAVYFANCQRTRCGRSPDLLSIHCAPRNSILTIPLYQNLEKTREKEPFAYSPQRATRDGHRPIGSTAAKSGSTAAKSGGTAAKRGGPRGISMGQVPSDSIYTARARPRYQPEARARASKDAKTGAKRIKTS